MTFLPRNEAPDGWSLRRLHRLPGRLSAILLGVPPRKEADPPLPREVLVVRPHNQAGDLLAAAPLLRALKERLPECRITLVCSPANRAGAAGCPFVDRLWVYDKRRLLWPPTAFGLLRRLRSGFDWVLVPATVSLSTTACLLARLARARFRIGPASLGEKPNPWVHWFHLRVPLEGHEGSARHVSDRVQDLLRPLGIETRNLAPALIPSKDEQREVEAFLSKWGLEEGTAVVGVHPGAGKPQNRWPPERFAECMTRLAESRRCAFYFTGTEADREAVEAVRRVLPFPVRDFLGRSLPATAALIARSRLFVTNDTALMHVAAATRTPQVSLFGPTDPAHWAPAGERKVALRGGARMEDLGVEEVFRECARLLDD